MAENRRSFGRSARKRSIRRMGSQHQTEYHSAVGSPKVKPFGGELPDNEHHLATLRRLFLQGHERQLNTLSVVLNSEQCWMYLSRNLTHARKFRYEAELRLLVVQASRRFSGRSVLTYRQPDGASNT